MNADDLLLLDRWSDGDLSEAERAALFARLRADAGFADEFVAEARFRGQLGGLLADRGGEAFFQRVDAVLRATTDTGRHRFVDRVDARLAQRGPSRPSGRLRRSGTSWGWTIALVAAAIAIGVSLAFYSPRDHEPDVETPPVRIAATKPEANALAHISSASGMVDIDGTSAHGGDALTAGQHLHLGAGAAAASVVYSDGTRFDVAAGSALSLADEDGAKRVRLEQGSLTAEVAKQPSGRAMLLWTPVAVATVVGTRFTLATDGGSSDLAVSEGRVAFAAVHATASVEVAAGESARVESGVVAKRSPPSAEHQRLLAAETVILPREDELRWSELDWSTDLWEARRRAAAAGKPVLLWTGWGHPLGMADSESVPDRTGLWGDPTILRLTRERFVPAVADTWWLGKREDAVGRCFASLCAQAKHQGTTWDGFFCLDAQGALLGFWASGQTLDEARALLERAAAAQPVSTLPEQGPIDTKHAPAPPPDALRLEVLSRPLATDGGSWRGAGGSGRDHCWLSADEWRQLVPAGAHAGDRLPFPDAVARKLAYRHLIDASRGEATAWEDAQIRALDLTLVVEEAAGARLRLRIDGSLRLESRERSYAPAIAGAIGIDAGRITAFTLVAIGDHHGDDGYDSHARVGDGPLGLVIRLAGERPWDSIPPHALRDADYLKP
jgi:ferric-dicitrate binding protein FerR (iron transport regulator)